MKIIDLSWRLPGPLATYLLAKQGFEVIKYEDKNFRDPFLKWGWDNSFENIYHAFQQDKKICLIDFSNPDDVENLHAEIRSANAVVMSLPEKTEQKLLLTQEHIKNNFSSVCFTRLAYKQGSTMNAHDLNTLVQSNLIRLHILDRTDDIIAPPMLPIAGMFYSHHIAITVLASILQQSKTTVPIQNWCFLEDATRNAQQAYYPETIWQRLPATFLHNGRFPCYNIYRTKDNGYMAIAVVEPKFWQRFRELTGLTGLSDDDGLAQDSRADEVKKIIFEKINLKNSLEWAAIFENENCCVDIIFPD